MLIRLLFGKKLKALFYQLSNATYPKIAIAWVCLNYFGTESASDVIFSLDGQQPKIVTVKYG